MRGKNSFKHVFNDGKEPIIRRGRSSSLLILRNECLTDRYYYYGHFTDKRYDLIMEQLSLEFFLSTTTIRGIVEAQLAALLELKELKPGQAHFQKKWPHFKWP